MHLHAEQVHRRTLRAKRLIEARDRRQSLARDDRRRSGDVSSKRVSQSQQQRTRETTNVFCGKNKVGCRSRMEAHGLLEYADQRRDVAKNVEQQTHRKLRARQALQSRLTTRKVEVQRNELELGKELAVPISLGYLHAHRSLCVDLRPHSLPSPPPCPLQGCLETVFPCSGKPQTRAPLGQLAYLTRMIIRTHRKWTTARVRAGKRADSRGSSASTQSRVRRGGRAGTGPCALKEPCSAAWHPEEPADSWCRVVANRNLSCEPTPHSTGFNIAWEG